MSRRQELLVAAGAMLAAMLLAALAFGGGILFTRPLWLDEVHTLLVAGRATPVQVVADLAHGVDLAPPTLHLVAWTARVVAGPLDPARLHALSFVCVWTAVVLTYAALRWRFEALPALAGAIAVASHPLVVAHAFEARYYGPWLLGCAMFCWSLGIDSDRRVSRRRDVATAASAVLVCTIHWFGVLTLALMCAGSFLGHPEGPSSPPERSSSHPERSAGSAVHRRVRLVAPALAGVVALIACSPLLFMQRALFTTPMWVPDLNAAQIVDMVRAFFLTVVPLLAALILLAGTFGESRLALGSLYDPGIAAMIALALMPALITLVSWLVQPTMLPRYAIATTLAWAPLAAFAAQTLRRPYRIAWCVVLFATFLIHVRLEAIAKRDFAVAVASDARAFRYAAGTGIPIVFQARHVLYPVAVIDSSRRAQMSLLELSDAKLDSLFPTGTETEPMQRFFRFEREAVRLHVAAFHFPRLVAVAALDSQPRFFLVASDASLPRGYKDVMLFGRAVFPGFRATRLRENLTMFSR